MLKQKINLRMANQDATPIVNLVQNDTGREIECNILDFDIPAGATSKLWMIKPSGKVASCDGTISGNMVTVALTDQVVAEDGMCVAQLKITKDGKTLSSFTMHFNFEEDASTNGIISQEEIKLVETFITEQKKKLDVYIAEKTKDIEKLKTDVGNLDVSKADKTETAKLKEELVQETGKLSGEIDDASNGNIPFTIIPNKFYNPSGLVSCDGWSASEYIDIKDMTHIYTNWSKASSFNIFVDSEFNVIGGKVFTIKEGFQKTEVPEGACYVGVSNESAIMEEFAIWGSVKIMAYENALEISELKKDEELAFTYALLASNGHIPFKIIPNKFYNSKGITSYDGWSASEYIDIKDMTHIYTNWSKTSAYNIFVDSEFNVIGGKVFTIKEGFQKTEVPEGACYVGVSNESAIMEEFAIWGSVKIMAYENALEISELKKDIPTYYEEHVVEKIDLIREKETHSGVNGDEFIFITDYHMNVNANNSPLLINRLLKETGVHKTVFGGDIYGGYTTKEEALDVIADFYELFDKIKMFSIVGNHEYNNPSSQYPERQLSEGQVCSMVTLQNELMYSDRFIENYIIHNHTNKTMYLFVGCSYNSSISYESYNWVLNALKKNKGYNIIVFSHIGLDNNGENGKVAGISEGFAIISRGLDSFNAKTTYTYRGITYDYSDCEGEVICAFTGHNHVDGCIQTDGGINVISTTCDSYGEPEGGVIRTKGTVTEQAFDVINIDYDNRKIYMTRIGAGSDREFDY